nr:hypothetical protein GCM10017745_25330 [Saccharothrix mutabilis subsp. capreolus]
MNRRKQDALIPNATRDEAAVSTWLDTGLPPRRVAEWPATATTTEAQEVRHAFGTNSRRRRVTAGQDKISP